VRQQAVTLVSGTRFESAARLSYSTIVEHLPSAFLSPEAVKARAYDRLTVQIAARALSGGGNSVDVGAHCGGILRHLVRLSPEGRHWAFEPIPNLAAQLQRRFPGVHVEPIALSDYSGAADFHLIPAASAHSSLLRRPDTERGRAVHHVQVQVRQLDSLIPEDVSIAFIKVDVEGSEAEVLRGAAGILRRRQPVVVFECDPANLMQCIPTLEDASLRVSLLADFVAGVERGLTEVVRRGQAQHEYYYVASRWPTRARLHQHYHAPR
jgi:FkbM family methyltransferase